MSIKLINELSLYDSIFYIPQSVAPEFSGPVAPPKTAQVAASLLHLIISQQPMPTIELPSVHPALLEPILNNSSLQGRLYLASYLLPFLHLTYKDQKGKTHEAVEAAIREGVKLGTQNHYLDGIPALFAATELLKTPTTESDVGNLKERAKIGASFLNTNTSQIKI